MTQEQIDAAIGAQDRYVEWIETLERHVRDLYATIRTIREEVGLTRKRWHRWLSLTPYLDDWMTAQDSWRDVNILGIHSTGVDIQRYYDEPYTSITLPWEVLQADVDTLARLFRDRLDRAKEQAEAGQAAARQEDQNRKRNALITMIRQDPEAVRNLLEEIET